MAKKPSWSTGEIIEFRNWHERRIAELNYPTKIAQQLRDDREKWLLGCLRSSPK